MSLNKAINATIALIEGRLTGKDEPAGIRLLRLAADKDNNEAMHHLAFHLFAGRIVSPDAVEAERLLSTAAGAGHAGSDRAGNQHPPLF